MARDRRPDEVSAGGVVIREDGDRRLVCLVSVKGRWEIPKGHPHKGETAAEAAIREISEETGIPAANLRVIRPLTPSNYAFQAGGRLIFKRVDTFLVTCEGDPELHAQVSEVDEVRWFASDHAVEIAAFRDTKKLIGEAMGYMPIIYDD
jgi:8-oxo-dGTP pyrophosphatase MutT (NUDIX family)